MKRKPNSSLRGDMIVRGLAAVEGAAFAPAVTSSIWSWPLHLRGEDGGRVTKHPAAKRLMLRLWSRGCRRFVAVDESKER